MNHSNFVCMAICAPFSHLFYTYFVHKFHFSSKKSTLKPTWDVILMIDSYFHAHEFRHIPQHCCVNIL